MFKVRIAKDEDNLQNSAELDADSGFLEFDNVSFEALEHLIFLARLGYIAIQVTKSNRSTDR